MPNYNFLNDIIKDEKRIKFNEPMKNHTTSKVGGPCDVMVFPENESEIVEIMKKAKEEGVNYYVIGCGSNLLVADSGVHALIIKITNKFSDVNISGEYLKAYAGASMPLVAIKARNASLSGFEFACGIPGSIGGGIRMNAGAYGSEIANIVEKITFIDENDEIVEISKEEAKFGYRNSIFTGRPECVILSATFRLKKANENDIAEKMKENTLARTSKQPLEYPNFGSVFKRPEGYFVGKLVQDAGLKGYQIGGAQVSTKHTGFIVNVGDATCDDILNLIKYIQEVVYKKFNVHLEPEVVLIGGNLK